IDISFSSRGYVLIMRDNMVPTLILNKIYQNQIEFGEHVEIILYKDSEQMIDVLDMFLPHQGTIHYDSGMKLMDVMQIQQKRTDLQLVNTNEGEKRRIIKSDEEVDLMRKSSLFNDIVMSQLNELMLLPTTEQFVKHQIVQLFSQLNISRLNFSPIVATGVNTVYPHHVPGEVGITEGSMTLIDMGCVYDGYRSDMTRMVVCEDFKNSEFSHDYDVIRDIQSNCIQRIRPGVDIKEIDIFVRKELEKH